MCPEATVLLPGGCEGGTATLAFHFPFTFFHAAAAVESADTVLAHLCPRHCSASSRRRRCPRCACPAQTETRIAAGSEAGRAPPEKQSQSPPGRGRGVVSPEVQLARVLVQRCWLLDQEGSQSTGFVESSQLFLPHSFWNKVTPCEPVKYFPKNYVMKTVSSPRCFQVTHSFTQLKVLKTGPVKLTSTVIICF